jgi:hypothetical protein
MSTRLSPKSASASAKVKAASPSAAKTPAPAPAATAAATGPKAAGEWTFLTNHAHILLCLAADPELRVRDLALRVGITERAVQKIIAELEAASILARERDGRRNRYTIHGHLPLRHPVEAHRSLNDLIRAIL